MLEVTIIKTFKLTGKLGQRIVKHHTPEKSFEREGITKYTTQISKYIILLCGLVDATNSR